MCFKDSKRREIMAKQSNNESEKKILQIFSQEWRKLSGKERAYWEEQAREDKLRYVREKNEFKGTWNLPKKRAKKHPGAPKVCPATGLIRISSRRRPESCFFISWVLPATHVCVLEFFAESAKTSKRGESRYCKH
jgi:hypothetical protein